MMGQKVNSNTLRIGKTLQWHSNWYNKLNYSFFLICDFKIREAIHDIFLCLKKLYFKISIVHILNKIVVHFHLVLFEKIKTFYLVKKKLPLN